MPGDRYQRYFSRIAANREKLESLISGIEREKSAAGRRNLACLALSFACAHSTGLYSSNTIEKVFVTLAREHQIDLGDLRPEKNSVLQVVTTTYLVGGHTRVLERWIAQAEPGEKHSVVLLNQKDPAHIPPKLRDLVRERGGEFLVYDHRESLLERALKLRRLGQAHEYVVLHIHPNDPIPLLAFGTEQFTRPVVLFNHADHAFWCGVAIADLVLDLSRTGRERTLTRRGVARSEVLGIPLDSTPVDRRRAQGFPHQKKMVLVSGLSAKFRHISGDGMADILLKICENEDVLVLAIGPNPDEPAWARAVARSAGRLRLSPPVDYDKQYLDYLAAADLVLDSYPLGGGTAVIDAVRAGRPVLGLKTAVPQSDFFVASESYCRSEEELLAKAGRILRDERYASEMAAGTLALLERDHSAANWSRRRREVLGQLPPRHQIHESFLEGREPWRRDSTEPLGPHCRQGEEGPSRDFEITDFDVLIGVLMEPKFFRKNTWDDLRHFFFRRYRGDLCRYLKVFGRYLTFENRIF